MRRAPRPSTPPRRQHIVGPLARLAVAPDIEGPRVRLGFLWFFMALAAITAGRWWTSLLVALIAALAAHQVARVWTLVDTDVAPEDPQGAAVEAATTGRTGETATAGATTAGPQSSRSIVSMIAAVAAALVPLTGGYSTGLAGLALIVVAAIAGSLYFLSSAAIGGAVAIAVVLAAIPTLSIVLALRADLWAALFLVLGVSLYDAGNFLLGADAAGRWEGPVAGAVGVLAVTFTMATIDVAPFDRPQWWIAGTLVALTCAVGQWVTSWALPSPTTLAPAMRRLDAYVVAGPLFVACTWLLGS